MSSNFKDLFASPARSGSHSQQLRVLESAARAARGAYAGQIQGMIERLLDAMFRYAESTVSAEDSRRVLSAYGVLYEHRIPFARLLEAKIQASLNRTIDDFLNHRQTTPGMTATTPKRVSLDELSLVETSDMDRMVAMSNLSKRVENEHYEIFNDLNARLAALVGLQQVETANNPFRAEFLLQAIEEAWAETRSDPNHDRVLIERSTPQIVGDFGAVLKAAVDAFQRLGIGPVKFGIATSLNRSGAAAPDDAADAADAAESPVATARPGFLKRVQQLLARQLSQRQSGAAANQAPQAQQNPGQAIAPPGYPQPQGMPPQPGLPQQSFPQSSGFAQQGGYPQQGAGAPNGAGQGDFAMPPGMHGQPETVGDIDLSAVTQMAQAALGRVVPQEEIAQTVSALGRLQQAQVSDFGEFATALALPGSPAAFQEVGDSSYLDPMSPADVALRSPGRFVNIIRSIAESEIGKSASQMDSMVIELVARLFDFVFDDENLPDAIKVLLSRLQIPVLKAAMIDAEFFELDYHPARRLVNVLADAGLGWEEYDGREDPLYEIIERTVGRILREFSEDVGLFGDLADEVRDFVHKTEEETREAAAEQVQAAQSNARTEEDRVYAMRASRAAIEDRLRSNATADFVAGFLRDQWCEYIGDLLLLHGSGHEFLKNAFETADDLLWSVQPKFVPEERRLLLVMMANLERQLRSGASAVRMTVPALAQFFARLDDRWAGAVIGEPLAPAQAEPPPLPPEMVEPEPDDATRAIDELVPGAILEMTKDDGARFVYKVGWISGQRTRFLLTNRYNSAPLIVSGTHLAERLRIGKLRVIDRGAIIDRAFSSILEALEETRYPQENAVGAMDD